MGLDIHAVNFLKVAANKQLFGNTLTIGRQKLYLIEADVKHLLGTKSAYKHEVYCEYLLTSYFGATAVESLDFSDYEGTSLLHDLNSPIPADFYGRFDTVIDAGSLEHIYNVPNALKNLSSLCKPGGQILHILPANNFCGHGFWQFSPELFFSLYSNKRGYKETEIFLADFHDFTKWFKVKEPAHGNRVDIMSLNELHVLVRTVLTTSGFDHSNVQQSDYDYVWKATPTPRVQTFPAAKSNVKNLIVAIKQIPFLYGVFKPIHNFYLNFKNMRQQQKVRMRTGLNAANPNLIVIKIAP